MRLEHPRIAAALAVACILPAGCHPAPDDHSMAAAIASERPKQVAEMLAAGRSPDEFDSMGFSALSMASRIGDAESIERLIRAGADPNLRDARSNDWTPLLNAIHKNQLVSVERLLALGANPSVGTSDGWTPLMMAAGYGYTPLVIRLLDAGADALAEMKGGVNALNAAIGGSLDIDRFTVGKCQTATVKVLLDRAPGLQLKGSFWTRADLLAIRFGGCDEVMGLLALRQRSRPARHTPSR